MPRDYIFSARSSRLLRTRIPRAENISVALVLSALIALVVWIITTRDNFDPTERDLPIELLQSKPRDIPIYTRPLKLWVDPAQPLAAAAFDLGPFPASILDAEWQPVGRVKRFQADNLYEKINGEAEKFIKQGFVELAYLLLRSNRDGSEIAIELFDQGDLGGSLGVFAEHASGRPVEEISGVNFFTTGAGVVGRKDRYFFRVAADRQSPAITAKSADLASAFAVLGNAPTATRHPDVPPGFVLLNERLGIAEADIQFQESNVFQYDFAQRFWFADAGLGGDSRIFVHIADDAVSAEQLLLALLEEQRYEYDEVGNDGGFASFKHRFLKTYFIVTRRGRYVYGMEKLP
ncbi:MAG: hypothetical protein OET44_15895, partial [Gammaproteobacteria bacterium]|nr:hypothetical protein [Gammaproteobacteria bacterium]